MYLAQEFKDWCHQVFVVMVGVLAAWLTQPGEHVSEKDEMHTYGC